MWSIPEVWSPQIKTQSQIFQEPLLQYVDLVYIRVMLISFHWWMTSFEILLEINIIWLDLYPFFFEDPECSFYTVTLHQYLGFLLTLIWDFRQSGNIYHSIINMLSSGSQKHLTIMQYGYGELKSSYYNFEQGCSCWSYLANPQ